jgi:hypothetical protein
MREREITDRAEAIGKACRIASVESPKYGGFVFSYARKGAEMALREVSHLLPKEPLDPPNEALRRELTIQRRIYENECEKAKRDLAHAQQQIARLDADYQRYFASGIETEGHDGETRHGAKHESPTPKGDAQP